MQTPSNYNAKLDLKSPNKNLWDSLLGTKNNSTLNSDATILISTSRDFDSSIISKQLEQMGTKSSAVHVENLNQSVNSPGYIDYSFTHVWGFDDKDESETSVKLHMWILRDDRYQDSILPYIYKANPKNLLVIICVDLCKIISVKDQLEKQLDSCSKLIKEFIHHLPLNEQEELLSKNYTYLTKMNELIHGSNKKYSLSINLGIPLIVYASQKNIIYNGDNYSKDKDVIISYLRKLCFNYGAALCCNFLNCPAKEDFNQYCLHRLYGINYGKSWYTNTSNYIFIPAGYDTAEDLKYLDTLSEDYKQMLQSHLKNPLLTNKESIEIPNMNEVYKNIISRHSDLIKIDNTQPTQTNHLKSQKNVGFQDNEIEENSVNNTENNELKDFFYKLLQNNKSS